MPFFIATVRFFVGGSDSYSSCDYADAHAWARRQCGKNDLVEIGACQPKGDVFRKVRGNLVAA